MRRRYQPPPPKSEAQSMLEFARDMVRGYFYFTQQASCYIVIMLLIIGIPLCLISVLAYFAFIK